ncbi:hypothetical protein [Bacteroides sp. UBA939]|uniref:hypothetical protein n=1 Tax=Bacteroides sp. UBA939 TaxID=1946092 RepID=UPI0025C63E6A|nr:hypothetical protein [Bacteroides sp. UBA939]
MNGVLNNSILLSKFANSNIYRTMKMANLKIWMVALTALMGVSLTSCFNSEDDPIYVDALFTKCVNSYPPTFELPGGQQLVLTTPITMNFRPGEIYYLCFQFNTDEQSVDAPSINVTLYNGIEPVSLSAKGNEGPTNISESTEANSALYAFSGSVYLTANSTNIDPFVFFDNEYLYIRPVYWVKEESNDEKQKEEFAKHAFILTYDLESINQGDTELVLTINHVITETSDELVTRNKYTLADKVYRLTSALAAFQAKAGQRPTKIKVVGQVNRNNNSLDEATENVWDYTINL